ncbi:partitioning protein-like protein [Microcystis phage Mwe-JY08]
MRERFETIDVAGFARPAGRPDAGPAPMQRWLAIGDLVIDRGYQREIGERGRRTIRAIMGAFDWSRFAPVVVAPVEGGKFAIIDGQHRATAAAVLGIEEVPCHIVQADRAAQAKAFAAINGTVTAITPMQMFHAKVTAGDEVAARVARLLEAGGARVLKYPVPADLMKAGDTLAAAALLKLARRYEDDTLLRAIQCVTETGEGNPGMLRAGVMTALCEVLDGRRDWRDDASRLFRAMDTFGFEEAWDAAGGRGSGTVTERFRAAVYEHLAGAMGAREAA